MKLCLFLLFWFLVMIYVLQVFGASPASDLQEKFGEVIMFTQHVR